MCCTRLVHDNIWDERVNNETDKSRSDWNSITIQPELPDAFREKEPNDVGEKANLAKKSQILNNVKIEILQVR